MANKKVVTSAVAVAAAAVMLLGGTLAWQSTNQVALNEASDVINPGGRLHDDFDGENKDVYVENFADEEIFARIRLEEYFEIIANYGSDAAKSDVRLGSKNDDGSFNYDLFNNYETISDTGALAAGVTGAYDDTAEKGNDGYSYWTWQTGGSTVFMPTFNKNKDSLAADINGIYEEGNVGTISNRDGSQYTEYVEYADGETLTADATYDADANDIEDDGVTLVSEEHTAASTLGATLISMQQWIDEGMTPGEYWVYDTDGWVYWAQAIQPGEATGLLLDGIELNQVMDDTWYYAINVVAQFVTADDLGKTNGTGFYDTSKGNAPSAEALELLKAIGVNTEGAIAVSTAEDLKAALADGEDVTINGTIQSGDEEALIPNFDNLTTADYVWTEGGTLNGGTLTSDSGSSHTLFINNENDWPEAGDGANAATINDTTINSASRFVVYAQPVHADVTLNNTTLNGDRGGILAEFGGNIYLNDVTVNAAGNDENAWINSAVAVGNGTTVNIDGGSYTGTNAVTVCSSGATVNIYDGYFDGNLFNDAGANGHINIYGGTFTVDPTQYVDTENYDVVDNGDGTYTVQEKEVSNEPVTLTYTIVDGTLTLDRNEFVTLKVDGEYTADDLTWELPNYTGGATCVDPENLVENEDGSATITHKGSICGGGGTTVRVSLTSDPSVYLDIDIFCARG